MSVCYKLFLTLSIVIPILFYLFINDKLFPHPELDSIIPEKKWFGPGEPTRKPEFIRPFKVLEQF